MTNAEISALLRRYAKDHETDVYDRLFVIFRRQAINRGLKCMPTTHGYRRDEIAALALEGLWKALETFDPDRGTLFITHMSWVVPSVVRDGMRSLDNSRRPKTVIPLTTFVRSMENEADNVDESSVCIMNMLQFKRPERRPDATMLKDLFGLIMPYMRPVYRKLIEDIYYRGMTQREIALREGVTSATITFRKHKAFAQLRWLILLSGGGCEEYERGAR